jgi:hypothetical protein
MMRDEIATLQTSVWWCWIALAVCILLLSVMNRDDNKRITRLEKQVKQCLPTDKKTLLTDEAYDVRFNDDGSMTYYPNGGFTMFSDRLGPAQGGLTK